MRAELVPHTYTAAAQRTNVTHVVALEVISHDLDV